MLRFDDGRGRPWGLARPPCRVTALIMSDRHDDHDLSSVDITAEFWGTTRSWSRTGSVPVTGSDPSGPADRPIRSRGNRTGRVERTRSHRIVTPGTQRPVDTSEATVREAGIGELARGVPAVVPVAPATSSIFDDRGDDSLDVDEMGILVHEIDLDAAAIHRRGWFESTADRLGLGGVDPLLLRLGLIVLVGVLLVPLALSLRADAAADSVEVSGDPVPAAGAAPEVAPVTAVVEAPAPAPTDTVSAATTTTATVAAASGATTATADAESSASAQLTDDGMIDVIDAPAVADAPAQRIEPVCAATYTVHDGDYWLRLADESGVALSELLGRNVATIDTPLFAGDEVCLPAGAAMPAPPPAPTTVAPTTAPRPTTTAPPATTAATTAPPATTAAPAYTSPEQNVAIIREVWPDDLEEKAIQVAWRESNWRAEVFNGTCCYGLFQIYWTVHRGWLDDFGVTSSTQLFDARTNARMALEIYRRAGGWGPWGG
jgi:hypothetical protein